MCKNLIKTFFIKISNKNWDEIRLLWKHSKENLSSNEVGSLGRLQNLLKKSQKTTDLLNTYGNIIQSQLEEVIIKEVDESNHSTTPQFYLPRKPVIKENADSTKGRIMMRQKGLMIKQNH